MKKKTKWIISIIIGILLINIILINFYLENREKEYFEKNGVEGIWYYDREYDKEDIQNVNVNLDGSSVIRKGNTSLLIVHIKNTNKKTDLIIENIKISNFKNEIIKEEIIKQEIKPIRKKINKINNIMNFQINGKEESFFSGINSLWKILLLQRIAPKLKEGGFRAGSYSLDIRNFSSSLPPKIGERVNIFVEVEFSYEGGTFIAKRSHSVLISQPLPSPPHD